VAHHPGLLSRESRQDRILGMANKPGNDQDRSVQVSSWMHTVHEQFKRETSHYGQPLMAGTGALEHSASTLRFTITSPCSTSYSNAQLDDYRGLSRRRFPWRPPLKLSVRARFSSSEPTLQGTAGFGFWNDPFLMTQPRLPALPRAIWFFYASPPSNMKLDWQVAGYGWKAAAVDASRPPVLLWLPLAPILVPLMNLTTVYHRLWPPIQRMLRISEARLRLDMTQWHTYILDWGVEQSTFSLHKDENPRQELILKAPSPRGPLGFVMWMDNQYLIVTPWGKLRWGLTESPGPQWMEIDWFRIEPQARDPHWRPR